MTHCAAFLFGVALGWALAWRRATLARAVAESEALAKRLRELLARMDPQ